MNKLVNVVVVGAGYFANFHINAWRRMSDVRLIAIVEQDTSKHNDLKVRFGEDLLITSSLQAAFEHAPTDGTIDLVDIATPPHSHEDLIEQSLNLQCPLIVCQKPFCGSYEAAVRISKRIHNSHSKVVVHENFRFQPWFRTIKSELERDTIGTVLQATFRLRPGDGQGREAYQERQPYFREMEKFLIHETGIHYIDVFRFLFGEPAALSADLRQLNTSIAGEDAGHFIFYYNNGLRAHFDGNRLLDHAADNTRLTMGEMLIEGTQGSLALHGNGQILKRSQGSTNWTPVDYPFNDTDFGGDCVYHTQKHIVDHLQYNTPLENDVAEYLKNLQLEELVYTAAESHTRLDCNYE